MTKREPIQTEIDSLVGLLIIAPPEDTGAPMIRITSTRSQIAANFSHFLKIVSEMKKVKIKDIMINKDDKKVGSEIFFLQLENIQPLPLAQTPD